MAEKRLVTYKKAQQETGSSTSFLKQLVREGKLTKHRINSAVFIDLNQFQSLAQACDKSHAE